MAEEFNSRHNCCKENDFEWISIDPLGNSADRLRCKICKREFIDTIFIKRLKDCVTFEGCCKICKEETLVDMDSDCFKCRIDKLAGDKLI